MIRYFIYRIGCGTPDLTMNIGHWDNANKLPMYTEIYQAIADQEDLGANPGTYMIAAEGYKHEYRVFSVDSSGHTTQGVTQGGQAPPVNVVNVTTWPPRS